MRAHERRPAAANSNLSFTVYDSNWSSANERMSTTNIIKLHIFAISFKSTTYEIDFKHYIT